MQYSEFLENYRFYSQGNETPELIHIWCGLSTLAGAVEKKLWMDLSFFQVYLNLYVILVGPAGVVSKSSSMNLASDMLKEVGSNVMEGSVVKERIIEDILDYEKAETLPNGEVFNHCSVTYITDELNVLLSTGIDMTKFLVDIFDKGGNFVYKTKRSGEYDIPHPYFNLLTAVVPQYFGEYIAKDMASTGFLARCIIIYEEEKRGKYPFPKYDEYQKEARTKCVSILDEMSRKSGPIEMTEEGKRYYEDWYMEQDTNSTNDFRINQYLERRTKVHTLKIAALMAIGDGRLKIEKIDFERAISLLQRTEKKMRLAYTIAGTNKLSPYIHQAMSLLDERGGYMELSELTRILYNDLQIEEIKNLVATMETMETAKIKSEGKKRWLVRE